MDNTTLPLSNQSRDGVSEVTFTISKSVINDWASANIPKYSKINSVTFKLTAYKGASVFFADLTVKVGGSQVLYKESGVKYADNGFSYDIDVTGYSSSGVENSGFIGSDITIYMKERNSADTNHYYAANNMSIVWYYTPPNYYNITAEYQGKGSITGTGSYREGTQATLLATPDIGYNFSMWSDGNTAVQRLITVDSHRHLTAYFLPINYTINYIESDVVGGGVVATQSCEFDEDITLRGALGDIGVMVHYEGNNADVTLPRAYDMCEASFRGWEDQGYIQASDGKRYTYQTFDAPYYANKHSDLYEAFGYNKLALINHYIEHGKAENRRCTPDVGELPGIYPSGAVAKNLATLEQEVNLKAAYGEFSSIQLPSAERPNHEFLGWYTVSGTKVGNAGDYYSTNKTVTLYAQWRRIGIYGGLVDLEDVYIGTEPADVYIGTEKIW